MSDSFACAMCGTEGSSSVTGHTRLLKRRRQARYRCSECGHVGWSLSPLLWPLLEAKWKAEAKRIIDFARRLP